MCSAADDYRRPMSKIRPSRKASSFTKSVIRARQRSSARCSNASPKHGCVASAADYQVTGMLIA
jgi:hypothetical protein